MILLDLNIINSCILLKTGGEPEKQLELQKNEILVKSRFLGYRFSPWYMEKEWAFAVINGQVNFRIVEVKPLICNRIVIM